MNKEVKELIEQLEEYASGGGSGLYPFEESVKALLDYINQLETNIDDAIKYINLECISVTGYMPELGTHSAKKDLLRILERGKE